MRVSLKDVVSGPLVLALPQVFRLGLWCALVELDMPATVKGELYILVVKEKAVLILELLKVPRVFTHDYFGGRTAA